MIIKYVALCLIPICADVAVCWKDKIKNSKRHKHKIEMRKIKKFIKHNEADRKVHSN